ncbi:MAG: nickel pincer cofactor biosynthesis protein LarC [Deltaproteobacteria bacterium]|nr:nickel pincer cofactor biosynthesis protein LarC [Deltaproteobacteria bacterium]
MKILYLDCFSGVSGDMLLGALIDLGCPVSVLKDAFEKLPIPPVRIEVTPVTKQGISAQDLSFVFDESDKAHRSYGEIRRIIGQADLGDGLKKAALKIFDVLAEAESKIHGIDKEKVHFHEVGGLDTICDVVGAVVAREALGIERVYASPLPLGRGEIECAHGILPNPAPATLELLKGFETVRLPYAVEFVTPTGAAIVRSWVDPEKPAPPFRILAAGYGAGDREVPGRPNVLRAVMGEIGKEETGDRVVLLETDIDDETPEVLAHVSKMLFDQGALDVTSHAVMMKKGRVGTRITIVAPADRQEILADLLLRETSTLGVRFIPVSRRLLPREVVEIQTSLGPAKVKVAILENGEKKIAPEYEACAVLAERHRIPLRRVMELVKKEAGEALPSRSFPAKS